MELYQEEKAEVLPSSTENTIKEATPQ